MPLHDSAVAPYSRAGIMEMNGQDCFLINLIFAEEKNSWATRVLSNSAIMGNWYWYKGLIWN